MQFQDSLSLFKEKYGIFSLTCFAHKLLLSFKIANAKTMITFIVLILLLHIF